MVVGAAAKCSGTTRELNPWMRSMSAAIEVRESQVEVLGSGVAIFAGCRSGDVRVDTSRGPDQRFEDHWLPCRLMSVVVVVVKASLGLPGRVVLSVH